MEENKRLKTQEDRDKLEQIYNGIFNPTIELETTMKKYFKLTKSLPKSNKGIAYMNDTCENVSKHTRKSLNKTSEYEKGEVLICREYFVIKKVELTVLQFVFMIYSRYINIIIIIISIWIRRLYYFFFIVSSSLFRIFVPFM